MSEALEKYQAAKKAIREQRELAKATAQQAFNDAAQTLFDLHPTLQSFSWRQYTPYFNDGDACEFSAHTDYPGVQFGADKELSPTDDKYWSNGEDDDEGDDEEYDEFSRYDVVEKLERGEPLTPEESAGLAVYDLLKVFDEDDYKELFGDHVKVVVCRNKEIKILAYEHD